jgi:hypothetical protein
MRAKNEKSPQSRSGWSFLFGIPYFFIVIIIGMLGGVPSGLSLYVGMLISKKNETLELNIN